MEGNRGSHSTNSAEEKASQAPSQSSQSPSTVPLKDVTKKENEYIYKTLYASTSEDGEESIGELKKKLEKEFNEERKIFYDKLSGTAGEKAAQCRHLLCVLSLPENKKVFTALVVFSAMMFTLPVAVLLATMRAANYFGWDSTLVGGFASLGTVISIMGGYALYAFLEPIGEGQVDESIAKRKKNN